jgi:hypothetical protein
VKICGTRDHPVPQMMNDYQQMRHTVLLQSL